MKMLLLAPSGDPSQSDISNWRQDIADRRLIGDLDMPY